VSKKLEPLAKAERAVRLNEKRVLRTVSAWVKLPTSASENFAKWETEREKALARLRATDESLKAALARLAQAKRDSLRNNHRSHAKV